MFKHYNADLASLLLKVESERNFSAQCPSFPNKLKEKHQI